jgi:hypothetical protein
MFRCALFDADTILLIVMFVSLAGAMRGGNGEFYLSNAKKWGHVLQSNISRRVAGGRPA